MEDTDFKPKEPLAHINLHAKRNTEIETIAVSNSETIAIVLLESK